MKTYQQLVAEAKTRVREVTVEDVMQMQAKGEDTVIVDVREDGEWAAGHIPGATHLSRGVLEVKVNHVLPDPETPIVLYCGGGNRSALAADVLQVMGYTNVASMTGGWRAWSQAGGETERDEG
jgi:rhodanese-related sulfurtransferase